MNAIGITQGRLSPPLQGRIQSFPAETWQREFTLAKQAGLDYIEWVYEADTRAANPLCSGAGAVEILAEIKRSGVEVLSVTADYYMTHRLVKADGVVDDDVVEDLEQLLSSAKRIGARYVMVPLVDGGRLETEAQIKGLTVLLHTIKPVLDQLDVELHMETDLDPARWASVLKATANDCIRACYDIGDRASLGYDPVKDFDHLGPWLGSVHIKDRHVGDISVPLGMGDADLSTCFDLIGKTGYTRPLILQTARNEDISELELAIANRYLVEQLLKDSSQRLESGKTIRECL